VSLVAVFFARSARGQQGLALAAGLLVLGARPVLSVALG
jgi:hypothetical protein